MFQNNFKEFTFDRINETVNKLRKTNTEYKKTTEKYEKLYNEFIKTLNPEQDKLFDEIWNTQNLINAIEEQALYFTALQDSLNLTNKEYISKIK